MSRALLPAVHDHATACELLGSRGSRRIGHNTWLRETREGVAVRYHETDIVVYRPDGSIRLDTGGWITATTVERMHRLVPREIIVSRRKGEVIVSRRDFGTMTDAELGRFTGEFVIPPVARFSLGDRVTFTADATPDDGMGSVTAGSAGTVINLDNVDGALVSFDGESVYGVSVADLEVIA